MKKALVTGVTGQDGSYLVEFLLEKGYEVHGIVRRSSTFNRGRIDHLFDIDHILNNKKIPFYLHYADLTDSSSIEKIIKNVQPNEIYNLAAQSHVRISFDIPENTANVVALGALRLLEAIKNTCPNARFYQASSSEMYGEVKETPQTENTPFNPMSPYACSKVFAHDLVINYRKAYGLHVSNGILFNHESERRGENFVTRKISRSLTRIKLGLQHKLSLGNLDAERDWGHAKDYIEAMWLMLQQEKSGDYVIGSGQKYTVREFLDQAIKYLGLNLRSNNEKGLNEKYLDEDGNIIIDINPKYFRPSEVNTLLANSQKAEISLGWKPKIKFNDLIKLMVDSDLKIAEREFLVKNNHTIGEVGKSNVIKIGDFKFDENSERNKILSILDSGRITEHTETREFEKNWAEKIGTKYSIAVNSGTSALIAGLYALKYLAKNEKRKKVITTPLTYIATSNAIKIAGLEPVYVDIDKNTFSILPSEIERVLRENDPSEFLCILPVHLMGYPCDMNEINRIAQKYNLFVFEDAAQAHGSKYNGKNVGSLGDLSDFSFYIAHNVQVGELGAVNTNNLEIRNLIRKIKANGRLCVCDICRRNEGKCPEILKQTGDEDYDPRFTHDIIGFNFKTMDLITGLGNIRLKKIDEINEKRRKNVKYLNDRLKKYEEFIQLPIYSEEVSYLAYPIVLKKGNREKIRENLARLGVETRTLFACIPTQQPSFKDLKFKYVGKLPNAEYIGKNGFYVGCHQYLTEENLNHIIQSMGEVLNGL